MAEKEDGIDRASRSIDGTESGSNDHSSRVSSVPDVLEEYSDQLNEVHVRNENAFFQHMFSQVPEGERPTALWFDTDKSTSASIGGSGAELELSLPAASNEYAEAETTEHCNYTPGAVAVSGVGIRLGSKPTGEQDFWAGQTNGTNGFGVGEDSDGIYVFVDRAGSREKIYQENWSRDTLDGSGDINNPSGCELDSLTEGYIVRFPHLCYILGNIHFQFVLKVSDGCMEKVTAHSFSESEKTTLIEINTPLMIRVENNGTAKPINAYWSAMHYHRESQKANVRQNGAVRWQATVGTTDYVPLISIKTRTGWESVNVRPAKLRAATDNDIKLGLFLDSTLSTSSFSRANHTSSSETAVLVDKSATSFDTVGERRWVGIAKGGAGPTKFGQVTTEINFNLPGKQTLTLGAIARATEATVDSVFGWEEEF